MVRSLGMIRRLSPLRMSEDEDLEQRSIYVERCCHGGRLLAVLYPPA
jgi:hypothetical protein